MSRSRTLPILASAGLLVVGTYIYTTSPTTPNPFRTPGVKNVERAYRGGGATGTHTPAYGGTVQGQREAGEGEMLRAGAAGKKEFGVQGPNEGREGEDVGEVQRPGHAQGSGVGKVWNEFKYGNREQK